MRSRRCHTAAFEWRPARRSTPDTITEIELLQRANTVEPRGELRERLAQKLIEVERYDEAEQQLRYVLDETPDAPAAAVHLTKVLNELGRFDEALETLEALGSVDEGAVAETANLGALRGATLMGLGRWDEAERNLRAAALSDPMYGPALRRLCEVLFRRDAFDEAYDAAVSAIETAPLSTIGYAMRLVALRALGQHDEADAAESLDSFLAIGELDVAAQGTTVESIRQALLSHPHLRRFESHGVTRHASRLARLEVQNSTEMRGLCAAIEAAVDRYVAELGLLELGLLEHPFVSERPSRVALSVWGNVFRSDGVETPHVHPLGWVSGVYYVSATDPGENQAGCLQFGVPPDEFSTGARPNPISVVPAPGRCVLFPSYYYHSTNPPGLDNQRISVAFDVMPRQAPS